jgi:hypothetical protein
MPAKKVGPPKNRVAPYFWARSAITIQNSTDGPSYVNGL